MKIIKERHINATAKKVWAILTETTSDWNGITINTKTDWTPKSEIIFSFFWDGVQYADKGKIIEFEPEKNFQILIGVHF